MAKLCIGAGRLAGIRPGDLVGAIANEAGLNSRVLGAIEMTDKHSFVEVPEDLARGIIEALGRHPRIKGQKVAVKLVQEWQSISPVLPFPRLRTMTVIVLRFKSHDSTVRSYFDGKAHSMTDDTADSEERLLIDGRSSGSRRSDKHLLRASCFSGSDIHVH